MQDSGMYFFRLLVVSLKKNWMLTLKQVTSRSKVFLPSELWRRLAEKKDRQRSNYNCITECSIYLLTYVYTLRLIGPISYLGACYIRTKVTTWVNH